MDPIHQFEIKKFFVLGHIGGAEIAFTNSALYMLIALAVIALLMIGGTRRREVVPGRLQAAAGICYESVAGAVERNAGREAMKFFPFVFSLFMFILVTNLIGLIPYSFAVMAQIIITAALAMMVFLTVVIAGFWKHGFGFFRVFVPTGVPIYLVPLVSAIEVISFITRPLSHSVRLFGNILAGHITIQVFAGFIGTLGAFGALGWIAAILPFGMTVALLALDLLVAFLQAYVFAILTCIYLNDAIHPGH